MCRASFSFLTGLVTLLFVVIGVDAGGNFLANAWTRAVKQTLFEQEVEDVNAVHRIDNHLVRRLIVMPLTDAFNPSQISEMHGKVHYGDKCSLPGTIGRLIFEKPYEVPWLFEITPVNKPGKVASSEAVKVNAARDPIDTADLPLPGNVLPKAYISPLDFRSPENYIFIPRWLMDSLNLKTNDLVDVSFVRIKLASLVVLQPLSLEWDRLMALGHRDPKTVLEHEVNKYSSLTAGSIIYIEVDGVELPLYVKETQAEGGIAVRGVRVQDSDIKVDIDRTFLDAVIKKKEKEAKEKEEAEEERENAPKARKLNS